MNAGKKMALFYRCYRKDHMLGCEEQQKEKKKKEQIIENGKDSYFFPEKDQIFSSK
jgi:hypothetical protein